MNLWLDDVRDAPPGWLRCYTVEEAKALLFGRTIEQCSLDHDLGVGEPTGYDLVCWMEETGKWPRNKPEVHSANPVGRARMQQVIDKAWTAPHENH